jgi:hypothetical protein
VSFFNESPQLKYSISGVCVNSLQKIDCSFRGSSNLVRCAVKPLANIAKIAALSVLISFTLVETALRIGLGLAALPLLVIAMLPCFSDKVNGFACDLVTSYGFISAAYTFLSPYRVNLS